MFNEKDVIEQVSALCKEDSSGHSFDHIQRVVNLATDIALLEKADVDLVKLMAYVHDVDDHKLVSSEHEFFSHAQKILNSQNVNEDVIQVIKQEISLLSYRGSGKTTCETLAGQIVQDADRIDAMGAIGIARAFAYGGSKGRRMFGEHPLTSQSHFYQKLIKLYDLLNTESAKRIAYPRYQFLLAYVKQLESELNPNQKARHF